jgi:hypothetical protein
MCEHTVIYKPDGSILASVYNRNLSADDTRRATFYNPIGDGGRDNREPQDKTVASCEAGRCAIPSETSPASK